MPTALPTSEISEILRHMPHRYPFLLVDRMVACEPNKWVHVIKNVTGNDPLVRRRPDGIGIMPQLLVLEALAQAAGVLCHYSGMTSKIGRMIIFFAGLDGCRFDSDAIVGDQLLLECRMNRSMRGVAKLTAAATVQGRPVVSTRLTAVIRDMGDEQARRAGDVGGNPA